MAAIPEPDPEDPRQYVRVYAALRTDITDGTIAVGTTLRRQDLAERFGVGEDTIKRALATLGEAGYAKRWPGKGWTASKPA